MHSMNSKAARAVIFRYILDSVRDTECEGMNDSDKAAYLWARFESEYNYPDNRKRIPNLQSRVAEWLSGLAIGIAYTNADIVALAEEWQDCKLTDKQSERVINNYFSSMAFKVMQLCKAHGVNIQGI